MLKEKQLKNGRIVLEGVTPKGTSMYARVHEPQDKIGSTSIDPVYSLTLLMDKNDTAAQTFIAQLDEFMKHAESMADEFAAKSKGRRKERPQVHDENYGDYYDNNGEPTDYLFVKAKAKASGVTQSGKAWSFKPVVFDAQGKPFPQKNPPVVGNGSVCRMAISVTPYCQAIGYGLSIHLDAVQVIDLVEFNGRSASSFGFESEDGYRVNDNAFTRDDETEEQEEQYNAPPKSYRKPEDDDF